MRRARQSCRQAGAANKKGRLVPPPDVTARIRSLDAEQAASIRRDVCLTKDIVARGLKLLTQPREIDVEQLTLPLAHLARDDHGLNVGAFHQRNDRAGYLVERRHVERSAVKDDDVRFLARRERTDLAVEFQCLGAVHGGVAQHVARCQQGWYGRVRCRPLIGKRWIEGVVRRFDFCPVCVLLQNPLVHHHALHVHGHAHLGEEIRCHSALDIGGKRRFHTKLLHLDDRRDSVPHIHLDREGNRDLRASIVDRLPAHGGLPGHVDEQVVGSDGERSARWVGGEEVQDRGDAEWREDVRRDLQAELSPEGPGLCVGRCPKVDLTAHDHMAKLVSRREPLALDAGRILRILIAGNGTGALEISEGESAPRVVERLDGGVRVLLRVLDLRHVVHRRDAVVELAEFHRTAR